MSSFKMKIAVGHGHGRAKTGILARKRRAGSGWKTIRDLGCRRMDGVPGRVPDGVIAAWVPRCLASPFRLSFQTDMTDLEA